MYQNRRTMIKQHWRSWRKAKGLTQANIAWLCDVSRSTAARWDDPACDQLPDVGHLATLCDSLRIDMHDALTVLTGGT